MLELLWIALSECYFFLSYMSGRNAFPQKLTPEQERDCLDRMLRGDEDARSTLIEHNLRLVAHVAKKYQSTGMESDDLISIGTVGLTLGVTPDLGGVSRLILIFLMYFGRVGGLTLIYAVLPDSGAAPAQLPQERVTVG